MAVAGVCRAEDSHESELVNLGIELDLVSGEVLRDDEIGFQKRLDLEEERVGLRETMCGVRAEDSEIISMAFMGEEEGEWRGVWVRS